MKIKKLSKNLNESEMKEFIIDRNKSHQEIEIQIDRSAEEFQELEQKNQVPLSEEGEFHEIGDLENFCYAYLFTLNLCLMLLSANI